MRYLLQRVAAAIPEARVTTAKVTGKLISADDTLVESAVYLDPLVVPNCGTFYELYGSSTKEWKKRSETCRSFVEAAGFATQLAGESGSLFGQMKRDDAKDRMVDAIKDSKGTCLLGVMVAELVLGDGKALRVVSLTGNAYGNATSGFGPHVKGAKGGQIHMEIFHFDRLRALIKNLCPGGTDRLSSVSIEILGYKNGDIVKENDMCGACKGAYTEKIQKLMGTYILNVPSQIKISFLG